MGLPGGAGAAFAPGYSNLSKNQLRSQGPGWGPDGFAGGAGAACAPGYSDPSWTYFHP